MKFNNLFLYFKNIKLIPEKMLYFNIISVIIFALLYFILDYIIIKYSEFFNKIDNKIHTEKNNHSIKSPLYYIWFSLITQTTVGYTGIIEPIQKNLSIITIYSVLFKLLNILQLLSIFIIPYISYKI